MIYESGLKNEIAEFNNMLLDFSEVKRGLMCCIPPQKCSRKKDLTCFYRHLIFSTLGLSLIMTYSFKIKLHLSKKNR